MKILILLTIMVLLQACLPSKNKGLPPEIVSQQLELLQENANIPKVDQKEVTNEPAEVISFQEAEKEKNKQCKSLSDGLIEAFADINYCETDSDCRVAPGVCPFGCYALYNQKIPFDSYEADLEDYKANCEPCEYKCTAPEDLAPPKCIDKRCIVQ